MLRRVLDIAVRWKWITYSPARDAKPPRVAKAEPVPVPLAMVPVLIEAAVEHNTELAACIALAADTGARRGELCAVRWSKVNFETSKVRFDRSIAEDGGVYEEDTKNHQHRVVSLSPQGLEVLRRHRAAMVERAQLLDAGVPVRTVRGRVGHLNPSSTTNIYSHWISESDERAADVVSNRIWKSKDSG